MHGDLAAGEKLLSSWDIGDTIHAQCFSPSRYWLCGATEQCIKNLDLKSKDVFNELRPGFQTVSEAQVPHCLYLSWDTYGGTFHISYTDGHIRVWGFVGPHIA